MNVDIINQKFKIINTTVQIHATIFIHGLITNSPISFLSDVYSVRGIIDIGRAILKNTCVYISKLSIACSLSPKIIKQMTTGITAITRVSILLIHIGSLMWMKPSITICPDNVPVIVEF